MLLTGDTCMPCPGVSDASGCLRWHQTDEQATGLFPVHVSAWKCPHLNRNDLTGMASLPEPC